MLVIDFETRSRCDLKKHGAYRYATDLSTEILCCAFYDLDTRFQYVWYPERGPLMENARYRIEHTDFIVAHNAEFDRLIWECIAVTDHNFPEVAAERWYCSSAQCRVNGLPASLKDAGWALGLSRQKFDSGAALIRKLSIPQKDGTFNEDPGLHQEMRDYCLQDVLVTGDIVQNTRLMSQQEHQDWLTNFRINDRGVKVDVELAELAMEHAEEEQGEISKQLSELTDGEITKHTQTVRIRKWIQNQTDVLDTVMTVYKDGVKKFSLDKAVRAEILASTDENIPWQIVEVVQLLDDGNKSSVAKFGRMIDLADPDDDRVRGAFVFAGASQTIRYTSRGLQLHNMRRDCWSPFEADHLKVEMWDSGKIVLSTGEEPPVMEALSKLLRPAIIPEEGKELVVGDWSAIEARVLPWLSDSAGGDAVLDVFDSGEDIYMVTAAAMGVERQIGKVAVLALGYQGGKKAFQAMARNYGLDIDDAAAQGIVDGWRRANQWAVRFWGHLDDASMRAMQNPGKWFRAGRVQYLFAPKLIGGTLVCQLPNSQLIQYPQARIEDVPVPWGGTKQGITCMKASFKPKADAKEWPRTTLYGGILCENVCQATAAAILRDCIRYLPDVIATVHDEIILEVPEEVACAAVPSLQVIMEKAPEWAEDLPLTAQPVTMTRYGK